ncbi:aminotransferase DegT [Leptospira perolatii]|uniref:Aminotransferase DegT n=1 Tax=Leptospira perolatii TaxID=2023191 RepID=A0A2M9ZL95_9LEPT|nr:DegT/DnrJ/EryC1/StrS family aminotransferase [Leptospira perolatii]PJZ70270.1 aminotransferase DegT [Leptospira perolatii]PJZ72846.1 aminotransferase DegT [Leptospira perolatii]
MNSRKFIPVCEPALLGNELEYVTSAVRDGWISSNGEFVGKFEKSFSEYSQTKFGVGVCNGTVALHVALSALGIGPGDEVIIPDFTMIATAFAVTYTGAMPVIVDADPETWNIDPTLIRKAITKKTKAIIPVHIMGLVCDMEEILKIAKEYNLSVLEDAAEAHGATYQGRRAGSFGDISAFSFYSNKNLTTGEGGMVLTNREDYYKRVLYFKNLCFPLEGERNYFHEDIGFNYRISNLHAAIGLAQIEKADEYKSLRRKNNQEYRKYFAGNPKIRLQWQPGDSKKTGYDPKDEHVHWMNSIVIDPDKSKVTRDELMRELKARGIDSRKLFMGMSVQPSLIRYGCNMKELKPVSQLLGENGLYLPSSSTLNSEDIKYISETVLQILG